MDYTITLRNRPALSHRLIIPSTNQVVSTMQRMVATELYSYLQNSEPLLIDVREPWEFEICQLTGSINVPMEQIPGQLEMIRESQECVIICHHGVRSMNVIQFLLQQKIQHLINLDGGVDAWAREVDVNMSVY